MSSTLFCLEYRVVAQALISICAMCLAACADMGPSITDRYTVYTPIFSDNRVYYLKSKDPASQRQQLEPLGAELGSGELPIPRNSPLSVILRSVEIPAGKESGNQAMDRLTDRADYAVILDIGTSADGSSRSLAVWYQRGVRLDQSLNFSNLLVYYEPRWDERVAPYFRVRVIDVTTERNAETRRALERAHNFGSGIGALAANPLVSPLVGIAFTAAELTLANQQNRTVLDYSVQLYSSTAVAQTGSGELGTLKRGSYLVIGRPNSETRDFWKATFQFEPLSRTLEAGGKRADVPIALLTVGTFESVVPTAVIERSTALTTLLSSNAAGSTIEQVNDVSARLGASVLAFTMGEKLTRYRNDADVDTILGKLNDQAFTKQIGSEEEFFLVRAMNNCFRPANAFVSVKDVETYRKANPNRKCVQK